MLNGIRVIDLTSVVLGPYATMMLADLGADVIKVEPPTGDLMRAAKPARSAGMGAVFMNCNRGKRSIVLDLKKPRGREILLELCTTADVFVHSMRARAIDKLELGYEAVSAVNEGIVYCSAWGFDQRGPLASAPAYDDVIQGASGIAALNSDDQGAPRFLPTIVADKVTGLFASQAILAALYHRQATGEGQCIEVPMFECLASFVLLEHMSGAVFEPPLGEVGYRRMMAKSRRPYATTDGYMAILPYSREQWQRFLVEVGRDDLAQAEWVMDGAERSERIDELYAVVAESMLQRSTAEWTETLQRIDIPHASVSSPADLLVDTQLEASHFFERYSHPTEGELRGNRPPIRYFADQEKETRRRPGYAPGLGTDTVAVLGELGIDEAEIRELEASSVITTG